MTDLLRDVILLPADGARRRLAPRSGANRSGRYAGAINEFEQALAIEPNDQDILHNLKGQNRRNGMPSWPDKPTAR